MFHLILKIQSQLVRLVVDPTILLGGTSNRARIIEMQRDYFCGRFDLIKPVKNRCNNARDSAEVRF